MGMVFLLGSGISLGAGMPCVAEISAKVFSGDRVVRHSDATYYVADPNEPNYDQYRVRAEPAIRFAQRLRAASDRYFADILDGRSANYEDLANVAGQIADAISGEYENPALAPLLAELQSDGTTLDELRNLATESRDYIRDIVWRMLDRHDDHEYDVDHLAVITEGCRALGAVDLFELNHDRVLESSLSKAGIAVSDGFTGSDGDVVFWTDDFDHPIRHFKLHGSITWFSRDVPHEPWRGLVVARSTTDDPYHERGAAGELLDLPADGRPVLLIGTFDKPLAYDSMVFADQHYRFHESLRQANAVVVIGYGFRDKAVNSRLIDWIHGARDRRLVVAHGDINELLAGARDAIGRHWDGWISDGRLRVVQKWVADAAWADVAQALHG